VFPTSLHHTFFAAGVPARLAGAFAALFRPSAGRSARIRPARLACLLAAFCAMLLTCGPDPALAASQKAPAYRKAVLEDYAPRDASLRVDLPVDEERCKQKYGKNARSACASRPGGYGDPAPGARIRPVVPGTWRWDSADTLSFTPDKHLTPGTTYTVDLTEPALPYGVVLEPRILTFTAFPQAVAFSTPRLWTDPSPKAAHALSCTLSFAYPAGTALTENSVGLQALDPASGLRFGPHRLVWNHDRTEAQLYAPVLSLGKKAASARLRVAGMPAYTVEENDKFRLASQRGDAATREFSVQGRDNLFRVEDLSLTLVTAGNLGQEYELSLRTSLYMRPSALLGTSPAGTSAQSPQAAPKIIQLPRFRDSEATGKPYNWSRAPVLTADVLNRGRVLTPESLQTDDEPVSRLRFRIRPDEGGYIYVYLPAGLASASGITLGKPVQQVLKAENPAPRLDFLQPGNILALSGRRILDIHSTGLTAIRWEVGRVRAPFLALLSSDDEDEDAFSLPSMYGPLSIDRVSVMSRGELRPARTSAGAPQFSALDLNPFLQAGDGDTRGLMQISLQGMDGDKGVASAQRLVLVTDLGLMVKKSAAGEYDVFVSLLSGGPAAGALVQILGANGLPAAEARADAQGHARLPDLAGLEREKRPVAVVASRESDAGTDLAWLPLNDKARRVDYSAFPTAGRVTPEEGLNAHVFAQRGIFRPGETLRFGCIVRRADWKELRADLPLQAVLTNPAGTEVMRRAFRVGADGLADVAWASREDSPTGYYRLDVQTAGSGKSGDRGVVLGTARVRMEEFQPDTLELKANFDPAQDKGWLPLPETDAVVGARVTLKNLYGMPAADRRIRAVMQIRSADLRFPGYADYIFHDASPYRGETRETVLPEVRTGADGTALVPLPPEELRAGTVLCSLLLEGFEPGGGRAVGLRKDILLSPLKTILGYKGTEAGVNPHFIPQGREAGFEFLALNPALEKTDPGPLTFVIYARRYVTSLVTDTRGELRFDETPVDKEYARSTQRAGADGLLRRQIPTQTPGEYLLTVFDQSGAVAASVPFTVAGDNLRAGTETVPGILRARIDKEDYDAGETIQVYLSAPYDGAGLITVERDGVAAFRRFRAEAGDSVQSVTIPEGFEGRGYVNVSLVRDPASPDIYMAPHSYALVPFTAAVRGRDMGLALRAPERVRPGDVLSVAVSAREPGKALVFAVDEGVLQLTGFTPPSPLDYLLKDRALSVQSLQAFDLLMPDHARLAGRIPGFGGDAASGGGRFLNPFKRRGEPPLASWALVDVGPQETRVDIPVPTYYNGRVRITAVGSSPRTAGNAVARTAVRGDLVLTPQMPLTVAPGDRFQASAAVADNIKGSGKGKTLYLDIEADPALEIAVGTQPGVALIAPEGSPGTASPRPTPAAATQPGAARSGPQGSPGAALSRSAPAPAAATQPGAARSGPQGSPGAGVPAAHSTTTLRLTVDEDGEQTVHFDVLTRDLPGEAGIRFRVRENSDAAAPGLNAARQASVSVRPAAPRRMETDAGRLFYTKDIGVERAMYPYDATTRLMVSTLPLPAARALARYLSTYPYGCTEQLVGRAFPHALLYNRPELLENDDGPAQGRGRADALPGAEDAGSGPAQRRKRVEALLDEAVNAVRAAYRPGEGVGAWPGYAANDLLTIYAADFFLALRAAGRALPVDPAEGVFDAVENIAGVTPASLEDARIKAYGIWVLTREGRITTQAVERLEEYLNAEVPDWKKDLTGTLLAGSCAIMRMDEKARALVDAYAFDDKAFVARGLFSPLAVKALRTAVLAAHFPDRAAPGENDAEAMIDAALLALTTWEYSTFSAAQSVRALTSLSAPTAPAAAPLDAVRLRCLEGGSGTALQTAGGALLTLDAPGCRRFRVETEDRKLPLYLQVVTDGFDRTPRPAAASQRLEVKRVYRDAQGRETTSVALGEQVTVSVTARAHGRAEPDCVIADLLPGGFEMVSEENGGGGKAGADNPELPLRAERREDRMLLFTDLTPTPFTYTYTVRAVNRGRFAIPPVHAEAMYDRTAQADGAAGSMEVR
jgi:uncharacterized protein YfaS (alpha-2-macroglobulin family)